MSVCARYAYHAGSAACVFFSFWIIFSTCSSVISPAVDRLLSWESEMHRLTISYNRIL